MDGAEIQTAGELYPEIEPYYSNFLPRDGGHRIYFERCGNPKGEPILFLHGGPGAGCSKKDRRYFNPEKWQIILVDWCMAVSS